MSQVFREDGIVVGVTVIEAGPCVVTQVKTTANDGYEAVQLGFGEVKRRNKPLTGHYRKSRLSRHLKEVKADSVDEFQVGQRLSVDVFQPGEIVDVIGHSKGRGFAGVMKRHGFGGGPRTPRSVGPVPGTGFHRRRHHAGQGLQGVENGGPHGQPPGYGEGLGGDPSRP